MGNWIMNFLREQGILLVMGLLVLEGVVHQWVSACRYRKLRGGLQSLLPDSGQDHGLRRTSRRQEVGRSAPELVVNKERLTNQELTVNQNLEANKSLTANKKLAANQELDEQLLYLKQSLERIAAGRDQKLEEDPPVRHKLTPEQEAVIADILREYLS